jgi:predicted SAM-dependent methyltransferase
LAERLNLGAGNHYAVGWINLDRYDLAHHEHRPDVVWNVLEGGLPWDDQTFEQVYAGHFLEHVPYIRAADVVQECWRVLAPGGQLAVVGPDIEAAIRTNQPMWLLRQIVGDPTPETPGLGHEWVPTGLLTLEVVKRGIYMGDEAWPEGRDKPCLVPVAELAPPTWPNPDLAPWQCGVLATKPHVG